jgi:hypothetical protein
MDFRVEFGTPGLSDYFVEVHYQPYDKRPWHVTVNRVEVDGSHRALYTMDGRGVPGLDELELAVAMVATQGTRGLLDSER